MSGSRFLSPFSRIVLLSLLLFGPGPLEAQAEFTDTTLQGELWMPFQAIVPGELEKRVPDSKKLDDLWKRCRPSFREWSTVGLSRIGPSTPTERWRSFSR